MNRTHAGVGAAILLPVGVVAVLAVTPAEAEQPPPAPPGPPPAVAVDDKTPPEMLDAMERDLGLSEDDARARIQSDEAAARTERKLRKRLGRSFGGAYITPDGASLVVTVTDKAKADVVKAAGAIPKIVKRSEATLDSALADLSDVADQAPAAEVAGWYVDPQTNKVVVETRGDVADAKDLVEASGANAAAVTVVTTTEQPELLADVRGADAYVIPENKGGVCSVGFAVEGGYITAGHCGSAGMTATTVNREALGRFDVSSFPADDYAFVSTNENWVSRALVNNYAGGSITVSGTATALKGAAVCRSGITTGWQCGTVETTDKTVVYSGGRVVEQLTETTACAEPGDSGGPFMLGQKALGVTSGGSGDCKPPAPAADPNSIKAKTYYQPIQEILAAKGVPSAVTTEDGRQPTCRGYDESVDSVLDVLKGSASPLSPYYQTKTAGMHYACLAGPDGTDYDLYLQRWDGKAWQTVGRSKFAGSTEVIAYDGVPGYYAWTIRGLGLLPLNNDYQFAYTVPR